MVQVRREPARIQILQDQKFQAATSVPGLYSRPKPCYPHYSIVTLYRKVESYRMGGWIMAGWSERLTDVLNQNGCRARIVRVERLQALREEIERLRAEGAFGVTFYRTSWLEYDASCCRGLSSSRRRAAARVPADVSS
jgi:hypothetical protein